ncbi:TetR/AcrR family transcriptional regulator [Nicoliella spurrieriana]|uniref:TetR/AcrR family transcriptional regulator n=1 Tax=Nicoliella spurrieriana TaxID=2925830 RepID=A0A976X688_9LACO|nr:TetR/AcrR family transcriptional regulator [Nicoliella spurrieriana]UQS87301.1 TetR/AcrR family transcriptional regulator [Nicoliella spurrieriana]
MDLRVKRTIREIENSFIALVIDRGFQKVSVIQIAKQAEINPKTFYDHFQDKYDLAKHVENNFLNQYTEIIKSHFANNGEQSGTMNLVATVNFMLNNQSLRQSLVALQMIHTTNVDINVEMKTLITEQLSNHHVSNDPLVIEIIAGIVLITIKYYVQNPARFSVTHQLAVINELNHILDSFSQK